MKDYSEYLFCSDIDGTLTYDRGKVSKENLDAIERFTSGGGTFVIATGRYPNFVDNFDYKVKAPIIALNGTLIYDVPNDKIMWKMPMEKKDCDITCDVFATSGIDIVEVDVNFYDHTKAAKTPEKLREIFDTYNEPYKAVFVIRDENDGEKLCKFAKDKFGDKVKLMRSCFNLVEVINTKSGKANCMNWLRENLPEIKTTVAVGDFENDIEMIAAADLGYAVENAIDEVKAVANRKAPKHTENAIEFIVNSL